MTDAETYALGDLITMTANELRDARAATKDAVMQFEKCELEIAVSFVKGAKGGIRVWLINAGGELKKETVSTIKLSFAAIPGKSNAYMAGVEGKGERFTEEG